MAITGGMLPLQLNFLPNQPKSGLSEQENLMKRRRRRKQEMSMKAVANSTSRVDRLELGTRILLLFGFFWILAGGGVAAWIGIQQIGEGNLSYGIVSVLISSVVFGSAWFMKRELSP